MLRIGIIFGTTRPGRRGSLVAPWVTDIAREHPVVRRGDGQVEMIDLADTGLTLLDEPAPAMFGLYEHERTRRWSEQIEELDAFVFVTAEYNHSIPASLKNAVDHLFAEWNDKAAGIVSYGVNGGIRAAEHLRQVLAEVKVATVRTQPSLSVFEDFVIETRSLPGSSRPGTCTVRWWSRCSTSWLPGRRRFARCGSLLRRCR